MNIATNPSNAIAAPKNSEIMSPENILPDFPMNSMQMINGIWKRAGNGSPVKNRRIRNDLMS